MQRKLPTTRKGLEAIARRYGCASLPSINADAKTAKGVKRGHLTGILYMLPSDRLCPMSTIAGCREPCLVHAGRAATFQSINMVRKARTDFYQADRAAFMALLRLEIAAMVRRAQREGMTPAVRLNGTSDVNWANVTDPADDLSMLEAFRSVQFYDYTKSPSILRAAAGEPNWHVTASYSEASAQYRDLITAAAGKYQANIAVVFRSKALPARYLGRPVISGDDTDLRFLDPQGVVVGLYAKGGAKHDTSGFVVDAPAAATAALIATA